MLELEAQMQRELGSEMLVGGKSGRVGNVGGVRGGGGGGSGGGGGGGSGRGVSGGRRGVGGRNGGGMQMHSQRHAMFQAQRGQGAGAAAGRFCFSCFACSFLVKQAALY